MCLLVEFFVVTTQTTLCVFVWLTLRAQELQEDALRKEQQEQLRKKQQAERIALRFSLWVKTLQGVTEEELIKVRTLNERTAQTETLCAFIANGRGGRGA